MTTETQREPVPRVDDGELATALAFLRFARHCVLKKTEGLDDAQLRTPGVPSGTSLLGLVGHLTDGERYWFAFTVAGETDAGDVDWDRDATDGRRAEEVLAAYREAADRSDAFLTAIGDLDTPVTGPVDGKHLTTRWVLTHMAHETARHAGHADILREQIDGATGR